MTKDHRAVTSAEQLVEQEWDECVHSHDDDEPATPPVSAEKDTRSVPAVYKQTCPRCTFEFTSQGACNCICHEYPDHFQLQDALSWVKFCQQQNAALTAALPDTFYADRDPVFRIRRLVLIWNGVIAANEKLEEKNADLFAERDRLKKALDEAK